ncbi:MAG: ThuA domain-containing protein [Oscillospiraceae bacterium]
MEETYAEFFDIPQPDELIFTSWFDSGETFRSGCTWHRGYGKIFYFQPGHETNPSFNHPTIQKIIQNACRWAAPVNTRQDFSCPQMVPSLEEIRASK